MRNISRRDFIKGAAAGTGALVATSLLGACTNETECPKVEQKECPTTEASVSTNWLGAEPTVDSIAETKETELLIIGAGNGGLVAANTAMDENLDFLLVEQNPMVGDARHWVGAVDTKTMKAAGIKVSRKRILNELARYASYKVNMDLIKMWIDESSELLDYFETMGIGSFLNVEPGNHVGGEDMEYYVPSIWHTLTAPEGCTFVDSMGSFDRHAFLADRLSKGGHDIMFETRLVKLVNSGTKVSGAIFEQAGKYIQINAKNVILATGGYPGNPEMIEQLAPIVTRTVTACSYFPADKGQGIKAALWAGADMDQEPAPMIFDRGLVAPGVKAGYVSDDKGNKAFPGTVFQFMLGTQPFLKVNQSGKRFSNESCPYDFMNFAASYQKDGVYAMIVDSNVEADTIENQQYGCASIATMMAQTGMLMPQLEDYVTQGLVMKADTIEELAKKLNLPVDATVATVNRYNELCAKGDDIDYGKEGYRMHKVAKAPFYGMYFGGSLLTTCDGVKINKDCQVLNRDAEVIEGLYCVGDCSGSFFSGNYPEYFVGVAVGRTMTEGRHAVKKILGKAKEINTL